MGGMLGAGEVVKARPHELAAFCSCGYPPQGHKHVAGRLQLLRLLLNRSMACLRQLRVATATLQHTESKTEMKVAHAKCRGRTQTLFNT